MIGFYLVVMDLFSLVVGLVAGFLFGSAAVVFYMRWRMKAQLDAMQENMEGMFDLTEEMMGEAGAQDFEGEEKEE